MLTFNLDLYEPPKSTRRRAYSLIVYEDSVPDDWIEILNEYCVASNIACAISPIHNKDVYESGEKIGCIKKSHYHVLFVSASDNKIYFSTFKKIASAINQNQASYVESIEGAYLYLSHTNAPDKVQYNPNDILKVGCYEGVEFSDIKSESENDLLSTDLISFVVSNEIYELWFLYSDDCFIRFGKCQSLSEYYKLLKKNHNVLRDLMSSLRNYKRIM